MNTTMIRTLSTLFPVALTALALTGCDVASPDASSESTAQATDAMSDDECPSNVPAALTPAADQSLAWILDADGVQIYSCAATSTGFAWSFVAPRADLFDDDGELVGKHYVGPTWEAEDGSTVVGAKVAGVTVDATAIPWLLLTAKSHNAVKGRFSNVSSIQRLDTVGGLAPATGCDADHVGAVAEVPYSARYAMYRTKTHGKVRQCAQ